MPITRIPLSQPIETRNGYLNTDSKCVNGYFEATNGKREFVKRPGTSTFVTSPTMPTGQGQGLTYFKGNLYAVVDNVIYKVVPSTGVRTIVGTMTGLINGGYATCYFEQTLNDTYLFVHNQVHGYTINGSTGAFVQVKDDNISTVTILTGGKNYTNPIVTFSAPSGGGTTATGTVQSYGGIVTGITITDGGSGYTSSDTLVVTITDTAGTSWAASTAYAAGTVLVSSGNVYSVTIAGTTGTSAPTFTSGTQADGTATLQYLNNTDAGGTGAAATALLNGFPSGTIVPGACYLDTYTVIASPNGELFTSNANDPTTWNALNYITAEAEPDQLVGIGKHLNYIVTFGQWSIDWFYDAGTYPGSPLAVAAPYHIELGCANGDSIVSFENIIVWVGTSRDAGPSVYAISGTAPTKLSTPFIDRILQNSTLADIRAYSLRINGHTFYVLTLADLNVTIVYDVNEKVWTQWTMWAVGDAGSGVPGIYGEQYFRPSFFTQISDTYYLLDDDNGTLYKMSDHVYNDSGAPIYYRAVTDIIDGGTTKRKFFNRLEIVGDKVPAIMNIRHSDNDYKNYSPYRGVDLNSTRPQIYQSGAARRRSWEFLCTDNQPLRLLAAEVDFDIGELEQSEPTQLQYRT